MKTVEWSSSSSSGSRSSGVVVAPAVGDQARLVDRLDPQRDGAPLGEGHRAAGAGAGAVELGPAEPPGDVLRFGDRRPHLLDGRGDPDGAADGELGRVDDAGWLLVMLLMRVPLVGMVTSDGWRARPEPTGRAGADVPVAQAATTASAPMTAPVRTAAADARASIATPPANEPTAMPALTADAGSDEASGAPAPARLTTRCWIEGAMPMANRPVPTHGDGGDQPRSPPRSHIATSETVTPMLPTTRARAAFGVGEATTGIRADRRRDAVGEQEGADRRAGDAGDAAEERHEVGQRGLDRGEHQEAHPEDRRAPAVRTPHRAWPTARLSRDVGSDGQHQDRGDQHDGTDDDDRDERAAPADGLAQQGAERQTQGTRHGEAGDDDRHRPAGAFRRHDRGRRDDRRPR